MREDYSSAGQPGWIGRGLRAGIAASLGLSATGRVVAWLFLFIVVYRLGLPVLYSAALAALPWLMLPMGSREKGGPPSGV